MSLIAPEHRARLEERLDRELVAPVVLAVERHASSCEACDAAENLAKEIAACSERLDARVDGTARAEANAPTLVLERPEVVRHLRFLGVPAGHELPAFVDAVVARSTGRSELAEPVVRALAGLEEDYRLDVFTTPT